MPIFDAVYKQWIDFLDQCSLKVVTAKFDMSEDLVRSILKAKMYKILSEMCYFVIYLFNMSPFAANIAWRCEKNRCCIYRR